MPSFNTTPELSAAELCRLQTFPDGLSFDCSQVDIQKLLENAVPSLLAEVLARAIRVQLLDCSPSRGALKLMPPVRTPARAPEPVARVPRGTASISAITPIIRAKDREQGRCAVAPKRKRAHSPTPEVLGLF